MTRDSEPASRHRPYRRTSPASVSPESPRCRAVVDERPERLSSAQGPQRPICSRLRRGARRARASTGAAGAVTAAEGQAGLSEQPRGSNDAPRSRSIASHGGQRGRAVVRVLASWAARAGGHRRSARPGRASARSAPRRVGAAHRPLEPGGHGVRPNPGDLIVRGGQQIGIVESVDADGSIHTIEGISSNAVSRRTHGPDGAARPARAHRLSQMLGHRAHGACACRPPDEVDELSILRCDVKVSIATSPQAGPWRCWRRLDFPIASSRGSTTGALSRRPRFSCVFARRTPFPAAARGPTLRCRR